MSLFSFLNIKKNMISKWKLTNKTNKQNITRDIEIKNRQTVNQRGAERGIMGEIGEGPSRNMYKGPMDKAKGSIISILLKMHWES